MNDNTDNEYNLTPQKKWCIAVLFGIVSFIVYNPLFFLITSGMSYSLGGMYLTYGYGPNAIGMLCHMLIYIILIRILIW